MAKNSKQKKPRRSDTLYPPRRRPHRRTAHLFDCVQRPVECTNGRIQFGDLADLSGRTPILMNYIIRLQNSPVRTKFELSRIFADICILSARVGPLYSKNAAICFPGINLCLLLPYTECTFLSLQRDIQG